MSDQDEGMARINALIEQMRPLAEMAASSLSTAYEAAAQLAGDPVTPANAGFWQIAGNLFCADRQLDPAGSEIARLVDLSKAIATTSRYEDWAPAISVCDRLFRDLDGGEELGLSDSWLDTDWRDAEQRAKALRQGMQFHRVPRSYQTALADVVTQLMLAHDTWVMPDGHQLPQPWAQCCTYVVFAIAERVKATEGLLH